MRNLDHVAALVAVADAGSFAAAARRLGLSPAAVSKAVAGAEAELGVRLFARTTRAMSPTEAGAVYLDGCRRVLAALDEAEAALAARRDEPAGLLRVSMPLTLGHLRLVAALGEFMDRHPRVSVEARLDDRLAAAAEEGVDAIVRAAPAGDSRLVFRTLATPVFRVCASPAYLARRGAPAGAADLDPAAGRHECVSLISSLTGKLFPWTFRAPDGRPEERAIRGRLVVSDGDAVLAAGLAGLGLVQLPGYIAGRALAAGELVEVLPEHRHEGLPIRVGYLPDRHLLPKVRAFVDFLAGWFEREAADGFFP